MGLKIQNKVTANHTSRVPFPPNDTGLGMQRDERSKQAQVQKQNACIEHKCDKVDK